jgi:deoxyribonuclease-1
MTAQLIGGQLDEWIHPENYPICTKSNGDNLSGRDCAYKVNDNFRKAHDDMNNLVPSVGELNSDRSNFQYANILGEQRAYGSYDFGVDFSTDTAKPADSVKGNIARVYFHMIQVHGIKLDSDTLALMLVWDRLVLMDKNECTRNQRITDS